MYICICVLRSVSIGSYNRWCSVLCHQQQSSNVPINPACMCSVQRNTVPLSHSLAAECESGSYLRMQTTAHSNISTLFQELSSRLVQYKAIRFFRKYVTSTVDALSFCVLFLVPLTSLFGFVGRITSSRMLTVVDCVTFVWKWPWNS